MYSETEAADCFVFFPYGSAVCNIYFTTPSKYKWKVSNFNVYLHHPTIRICNILAYIYYQSSRKTNIFFTTRLHEGEILLTEYKGILFQTAVAKKNWKMFVGLPWTNVWAVIIFRTGFH